MGKTAIPLALVLGFILSVPAYSASGLETDSSVYKIRLENTKVRVVDVVYPPKAKVRSHSLPERLLLTQSAAQLQTTDSSGRMQLLHVAKGQTSWEPAETVEVENTGESEYRATYVEVK